MKLSSSSLVRVLATTVAATVLFLAVAASAEATFPGRNGKIAFVIGDGGIGTVNPDGSGRSVLDSELVLDPAWSPDGRKLAFGHYQPVGCCGHRSDGIRTRNADGSGETLVTAFPSEDPAWAPDGRRIAFVVHKDLGDSEIWVVGSNGLHARRLLAVPFARDPAWSPDGRQIAFSSDFHVRVMNSDGTGARDLTPFPPHVAIEHYPSWSPDSSRIAFSVNKANGNNEIYVMNRDGSGRRNLTANAALDIYPAWAPDATKIAFASFRGTAEIFTMKPDGSAQAGLTSDDGDGSLLDWQPLLPSRAAFKNQARYCKALRAVLRGAAFQARFRSKRGGGFGACVSARR
jgi:dipeptidyl aminopeptidase/acylaminoacyl peptidase